ncbi:tetratricopeptide repeat protein [Microcella alkaliphila]|uniref:Tetratricopeptide repeat protein n=1 Tax=Microcella alkaliphila TaxID=279828 RepID=A0A4Q7TG16_9MICO|nr:tetratricopeptide repeat protein [Microcella alkaliphila]RZT58358.1 tetratricopeptide repeat protein [Microcella alkaliphila]
MADVDSVDAVDVDRELAHFWDELDDDVKLSEADARLLAIVDGLPVARILFERASLRDALGYEADAVPLYEAALAAGLPSPDGERAVIQLASSLRNLGRAEEAFALLEPFVEDDEVGAQASAFAALCLIDLGRKGEAARLALSALAPRLPEYGRAVASYVDDLELD